MIECQSTIQTNLQMYIHIWLFLYKKLKPTKDEQSVLAYENIHTLTHLSFSVDASVYDYNCSQSVGDDDVDDDHILQQTVDIYLKAFKIQSHLCQLRRDCAKDSFSLYTQNHICMHKCTNVSLYPYNGIWIDRWTFEYA